MSGRFERLLDLGKSSAFRLSIIQNKVRMVCWQSPYKRRIIDSLLTDTDHCRDAVLDKSNAHIWVECAHDYVFADNWGSDKIIAWIAWRVNIVGDINCSDSSTGCWQRWHIFSCVVVKYFQPDIDGTVFPIMFL